MAADIPPSRAARLCPICSRPATREAFPFCSTRCADIDLGKWLSGRYRIAGPPEDDEEGREHSEDGGVG